MKRMIRSCICLLLSFCMLSGSVSKVCYAEEEKKEKKNLFERIDDYYDQKGKEILDLHEQVRDLAEIPPTKYDGYVETVVKDAMEDEKGRVKDKIKDIPSKIAGFISNKAQGAYLKMSSKINNSLQYVKYSDNYMKNIEATRKAFQPYATKAKHLKFWMKTAPSAVGKTMGVIGFAISAKDFYDNTEVGYKSSTLEFIANSIRGASCVSNLAADKFPPAALIYGALEKAVTSKTVIKFANDNVGTLKAADEFVDTFNSYWQKQMESWFFSKELKQADENEKYLQELVNRANGGKLAAEGVGVYKPNIYLYDPEETDFTVEFARPYLLTTTDPFYDGIWSGHTVSDGSIVSGGQSYGFLFYESLTYPDYYQTESGYEIGQENRAEQFAEILAGYGLNEQEIADFAEFWCDKLDADCDYAMYPQLTETVDAAMPMTVSPAPDQIHRLWFAFVKEEVPAKQAEPVAFARDGFTVIEWGGFFLGEE